MAAKVSIANDHHTTQAHSRHPRSEQAVPTGHYEPKRDFGQPQAVMQALTGRNDGRDGVYDADDDEPIFQFRSKWSDHRSSWIVGTQRGQLLALFVIFLVLIFSSTFAWSLAGGIDEADTSFEQSIWISWGLFFDPGTQTGVPADGPQVVKFVAVLFSIFGFIFNLAVLGLVVDFIRTKLDVWKQVHSRVVENGHALLLGWGDKTLFLICELLAAQDKEVILTSYTLKRRQAIVILANRPVLDMQQDLLMHLSAHKIRATNVKFREGDPTDKQDLGKVSAASANDILILGTRSVHSDQEVLQILLTLAGLPTGCTGDVFVEMKCQDNVNVVRDLMRENAYGIVARHAVNRLLILRALFKNVGFCYLDLVTFKSFGEDEGNELYLIPVSRDLVGVPFADVCLLFRKAVVCGLQEKQTSSSSLRILPDDRNRELQEDDCLILMARNMNATQHESVDVLQRYKESKKPRASMSDPTASEWLASGELFPRLDDPNRVRLGPKGDSPRTVIIIGCPADIDDFLSILDNYLVDGSKVIILSERTLEWRKEALRNLMPPSAVKVEAADGDEAAEIEWHHMTIQHLLGSTISRHSLAKLPLHEADHIIVLSEALQGDEAPLVMDSRNLTTIVHISNISAELKKTQEMNRKQDKPLGRGGIKKNCKTVVECLDPKTEHVVKDNSNIRKHGTYFYSNTYETAIFAMAAGDKYMYNVLAGLLEPFNDAGEIAAVSPECLLRKGNDEEELSFYDLHARVSQACGGVLLGWRRRSDESFWPRLNPIEPPEEVRTKLTTPVSAKATKLNVSSTSGLAAGDILDLGGGKEQVRIKELKETTQGKFKTYIIVLQKGTKRYYTKDTPVKQVKGSGRRKCCRCYSCRCSCCKEFAKIDGEKEKKWVWNPKKYTEDELIVFRPTSSQKNSNGQPNLLRNTSSGRVHTARMEEARTGHIDAPSVPRMEEAGAAPLPGAPTTPSAETPSDCVITK